MSKASDWIKQASLRPELKLGNYIARVSMRASEPILVLRNEAEIATIMNMGGVTLTCASAIELAQWILDTFTEEGGDVSRGMGTAG